MAGDGWVSDIDASVPSEEEWIPERGPAPPTELHSIPSTSYREGEAGRPKGHMCGSSRIELVVLAIAAAGPGYAERYGFQAF